MIVHPKEWQKVGQPIKLSDIESAMRQSVADINCDCLSFSGGVDSCLLLHFMLELGRKVRVFNVACQSDHPDIEYSRMAIKYFERKFGVKLTGMWRVLNNVHGDDLVKAFYSTLRQHTDSIIAGDGIDEFMCGYYGHQKELDEFTYYDYLRRLQVEHLIPLNENSGSVKVYLPYLDERVTSLLWQIPLSEKVDSECRKKLMVQLAQGKVPDEIIKRRKYGFATQYENQIREAIAI